MVCQTVMMRSACAKGSGRTNNVSAMLRIAVVAPMPMANTNSAIAVKPGALSSMRAACAAS